MWSHQKVPDRPSAGIRTMDPMTSHMLAPFPRKSSARPPCFEKKQMIAGLARKQTPNGNRINGTDQVRLDPPKIRKKVVWAANYERTTTA